MVPVEYIPLLKLVLFPIWIVLCMFILQKWLWAIVLTLRKLEDFVISFNKSSLLVLGLYFVVLAYVKLF